MMRWRWRWRWRLNELLIHTTSMERVGLLDAELTLNPNCCKIFMRSIFICHPCHFNETEVESFACCRLSATLSIRIKFGMNCAHIT